MRHASKRPETHIRGILPKSSFPRLPVKVELFVKLSRSGIFENTRSQLLVYSCTSPIISRVHWSIGVQGSKDKENIHSFNRSDIVCYIGNDVLVVD